VVGFKVWLSLRGSKWYQLSAVLASAGCSSQRVGFDGFFAFTVDHAALCRGGRRRRFEQGKLAELFQAGVIDLLIRDLGSAKCSACSDQLSQLAGRKVRGPA
jgi:hypothetical protein